MTKCNKTLEKTEGSELEQSCQYILHKHGFIYIYMYTT